MQRPGQDGDEKARPPVFTAPQAPGEKKAKKKKPVRETTQQPGFMNHGARRVS
jgi:hypothetical protein